MNRVIKLGSIFKIPSKVKVSINTTSSIFSCCLFLVNVMILCGSVPWLYCKKESYYERYVQVLMFIAIYKSKND